MGLSGLSRTAVNFTIHIGSAALIGSVLFDGFNEFTYLAIAVGAFFFFFDEWPHAWGRRNKRGLMAVTALVLLFTLIPTWISNYQVVQDLRKIDSEGFPDVVIFINGQEVPGTTVSTKYLSTGLEKSDYKGHSAEILPKGILEDSQYDIYEVNEGDVLSVTMDGSLSEDYTLELLYINDTGQKTEVLSENNNEFVLPGELDPQALLFRAAWKRHMVLFQVYVK
ncbi:hypothetical protein JSY36_08425 [Bacillus sp. H-16]|uniref:hypothetical protein n=1 Tax=Alteribacter salitolerans TaxID=2912333 RepID=UPI001963D072|nr:hypothetical protein [Alteribacter salitolerans]MBM7095777.1 hypothetical protein [Alteribacter salitolerans]